MTLLIAFVAGVIAGWLALMTLACTDIGVDESVARVQPPPMPEWWPRA